METIRSRLRRPIKLLIFLLNSEKPIAATFRLDDEIPCYFPWQQGIGQQIQNRKTTYDYAGKASTERRADLRTWLVVLQRNASLSSCRLFVETARHHPVG